MYYNLLENSIRKEVKIMFKGNKQAPVVGSPTQDAKNTYIAAEIEVEGNFKGNGSIQVEGTVNGNLSIPSVVIGEHGTVNGIINAKNAIVNGDLNGSIFCDTLEIMPNGKINDEIKVKQLLISGKAEGSIESKEEITIDQTGHVIASTMQSKTIVVNGDFKGSISASEILKVGSTGSAQGEITVKNIKTDTGGKLLGSIHNYVEETPVEPKEEKTLQEDNLN
ncbi:MAG TPA: polymer-forming cytoskeletal protein [Campylobacterales bacterium]|nr:polymer-forming cytoskeletal protein [Campylobacterales bacterium]